MTALEEYLRSTEPGRREKAYAWKTAIGLQQVDGLTPSDYLIKTACRNIEGEITLEESRKLIEGYYKSRSKKREQVGGQVGEQVKADAVKEIQVRPSKQVLRLLSKMKGEMTVLEMMAALKLGGRRNFLERYLTPALNAGFVERTEPDSAHSPTQRYRLTPSGKASMTTFDLRKC